MNNNKLKFGFCEVSMVGGVALLIASHSTAGIVLVVLGVIGALCDYALKFQQEQKAQEKIAELTAEIARAQDGDDAAGELGHNAGIAVAQLVNLLQQFMQGNDNGNSGNGWPN